MTSLPKRMGNKLAKKNIPAGQSTSQVQALLENDHNYTAIMAIGEGAFGKVFSALSPTGEQVAIKKVPIDPHFINRELSICRELDSPYCLYLRDSFIVNSSSGPFPFLCIVTELMPQSLLQYLKHIHQFGEKISPVLVKVFAYQLFAGIAYIHSKGITHRDIKPANCLIDVAKGRLKICDFGSAKHLAEDPISKAYIASRHYRAPELLLGCTHYTNAVDIWAAGCVVAEMLLDDYVMFQGDSNTNQISEIVQVLGQPTPEEDASFEHPLPFRKLEQLATLEQVLPLEIDPNLLQILKSIFNYDPGKRPTATEILENAYFNSLFEGEIKLPNGVLIPKFERC